MPKPSLWFVFALGFGCSVVLLSLGIAFFGFVVNL